MVRCRFAPLCTSRGKFAKPSRPRRGSSLHRDIKPAKIMIVADSEERDWPFIKLIDFGLACSILLSHDSDGTTPPGSLRRAVQESGANRGGNTAARSDIYSLGCTLWYLLTGEAPSTGSLTSDLAQPAGPRRHGPAGCGICSEVKRHPSARSPPLSRSSLAASPLGKGSSLFPTNS